MRMNRLHLPRLLLLAIVLTIVGLSSGCGVYFNTFFNAKKAFNSAEKARQKTGKGSQVDYKTAIDKCLKIIENNPNSKYYDDALYILAVSYYHTGQYSKSERRFREILANFPDSKFSRESNMYLAKSRLELGEITEAMAQFEEIFASDYKRLEKAEAALALGDYYTIQKKYDEALNYYLAIRDSLGDEPERKIAQIKIADNHFEAFRFSDALSAYLQTLGMKPTKAEEYHATYNAAICSYRLQRIDEGIEYLTKLSKDPLLFDSLETLQMTIAEGQELQDELAFAEATYTKIASSTKNRLREAQAWYRLGLIAQYNYDDLGTARTYYDKATKASPSSDEGKDALQRSSDITKVGQFSAQIKTDSTVSSQETIDKIANTQISLAELYWYQLNKHDSAMYELRYLIDSFPTARNAPRAMMALAGMIREENSDTAGADSILKEIIVKYPKSDYLAEVIDELGLSGTAADTGYAYADYRKAEDFLIDSADLDSARYYYQRVTDNYPDSRYNLQARFNLIWITDQYASPGDSSLVYAYRDFLDSFPSSPLAAEARSRLGSGGTLASATPGDTTDTTQLAQAPDSTGALEGLPSVAFGSDTSNTYRDPLEDVYIGPEGDSIAIIPEDAGPTQTDEPFIFPQEAISLPDLEFLLYFQVKLDFSGKVEQYILKVRTTSEEININASKTVASMTFNMLKIRPEYYGKWMVYKYLIKKPDYLR